MSVLTRMTAKISTTEPPSRWSAAPPLTVLREASSAIATGIMEIQVAAGASGQELRMFGTQGFDSVQNIAITSDIGITVSYNGAAPIPLTAGGFHAICGTTLTTVTLTNTTTETAHLTLWLAGTDLPDVVFAADNQGDAWLEFS